MPDVNPDILVWARETAGLAPEEAVKKLGINTTKNMSGAEKLSAYEKGVLSPSRPLLLKMSQQYRRPLVAFYMKSRPADGTRSEDFRNIPDRDPASDILISVLVRNVRARQSAIREILVDDESPALSFVASKSVKDGPAAVLENIVSVTGIKREEFRSKASPELAFAYLRAKIEAVGVFVLLIGNLGSHHTAIDAEAFRGFALADKIAPFVVVNDQDARTAWSFTLLHELAHIWLGASGISGKVSDAETERFCNTVANQFFLSDAELNSLKISKSSSVQEVIAEIADFAKARHISGSMAAYGLLRKGAITVETWRAITRFFSAQWRKSRDAQKDREQDSSGPNYYVVRRHRLGRALMQTVSRALSEGALTPTRASQILGVKPRSVSPLLSEPLGGRAA
ncbi:ImmA/IrrE family metallo-endopeptidase [Bradyrhizobium japonicum]|uniref:ImmA/IrrE family metallo-endopeptidase n=1 Tax=Bradyrhizobium japonicum TaxID=375 RepID=UPI001BAB99A7|nr:ImmA/IrrE family metallo-endopeptidase [Bradyrhizobium japonicum]MBR0912651.1 ImmA/IrrE family metallo-endopeptidase [Bradyrhizobium japonicum]